MNLPVNYNDTPWQTRRLVREEYVRLQHGLCSHCGEPLYKPPAQHIMEKRINVKLFPASMFKYPVHLHHSHVTGMTIGAVHAVCNAVLWQYHGE
jgi:hypothetical protein